MAKATELHEILAVEGTKKAAANKLLEETTQKFKKDHFFQGHVKTLKMIADSPENEALEEANRDIKELPTTVVETLEYALDFWANAEDIVYAKDKTNQEAKADLQFNGEVIASDVPVEHLLGLQVNLVALRKVVAEIPTLDASKEWKLSGNRSGEYVGTHEEVTSKTEKVTTPIVLYDATDKHPAQIEKVSVDKIVGTFRRKVISGAATSKQKADALAAIDTLIVEVKQARMRANSTPAAKEKIGDKLTALIMAAFN